MSHGVRSRFRNMKTIPADKAFTLWTRPARGRVVQPKKGRRVLEIHLGSGSWWVTCIASFVTYVPAMTFFGPIVERYEIS